jgi:hypothetical protein
MSFRVLLIPSNVSKCLNLSGLCVAAVANFRRILMTAGEMYVCLR